MVFYVLIFYLQKRKRVRVSKGARENKGEGRGGRDRQDGGGRKNNVNRY